MGVVDSIIGGIILIFTLIIASTFYLTGFAQDTVAGAGIKENTFTYDQNQLNVNNMFKITEPISGKSLGTLIADSVYFRDRPIFNGQEVNITNATETILELVFPTKDYYFMVKPDLEEVSLNFIIDGSDSMADERNFLVANIQRMMNQIETRLNQKNQEDGIAANLFVSSHIYLLSSDTNLCNPFNALGSSLITCTTLDKGLVYSGTPDSRGEFSAEYFLEPPLGTEWIDEAVTNKYELGPEYYSVSEWGHGTGFASWKAQFSPSKLTVLFPVSDELSGSSIADECFSLSSGFDATICLLCNSECPVERASRSVEVGLTIAKNNHHIIFPIIAYECNYDYNPGWQLIPRDGYAAQYPPLPNCGGLTNGGSCYHPNCVQIINQHMQSMATETGGELINLQEVGNLDAEVIDRITGLVEDYKIEIGTKDESREREVFISKQPLPSGKLLDLEVWVYKNI